MSATATLTGWFPYKIRPSEPDVLVDWCRLGDETFNYPFFEETVSRCMARPFNQLFGRTTPVETLVNRSRARPGPRPAGFIFHSSRCGSTLFSQMAAALPHSIAISEAAPVDQILRTTAPEPLRIEWLRGLVSALGQAGREHPHHLFIKFDAWHIVDLALVQQAFPEVPNVFLYREPEQILASQMRMPGVYTIPGVLNPSVVGLELQAAIRMSREEYCARLLAVIYQAAIAHARSGKITLMHYSQLPGAASDKLLDWTGLSGRDDLRTRIESVAEFDAKTPSLPYDRLAHGSLSPEVVSAARRFATPYYEELESIRTGG